MGIGSNFGIGGAKKEEKYFVLPKERQVNARANPGGWKVAKGPHDAAATTIEVKDRKEDAKQRARQLAKKNNMKLTVFDAALGTSNTTDYS